jgi:hypothetical protein
MLISLAFEPLVRNVHTTLCRTMGSGSLPGKESTMTTSRNALSGAYARLALVGWSSTEIGSRIPHVHSTKRSLLRLDAYVFTLTS